MMYINFNIASFGLRGTLQHIFDCLYITDNLSDAADQIFTETYGNKASLCSVLAHLNLNLIGLMGVVHHLFTCYWLAQRGGVRQRVYCCLVLMNICSVDPSNDSDGQVEVFALTNLTVNIDFPQTSKNKSSLLLLSSARASVLSVYVWIPSSESVMRL